eukprot:GHVN01044527.1.p1 GENE.GHVN01044527.1~~GHVN01044527.1.p1  ORF type:complete len:280 (+),score=26.01 GHVN01044527.1:79-918(+)
MAAKTVLVTGANGYIASHVIYQLLEKGHTVRGTVRNPLDAKHGFLKTFHPAAPRNLTLVPGDLMKEDGWKEAVSGVETVFHIASPFQIDSKATDATFVEPAVNGTTHVLSAAIAAKVPRVILTSSVASVTEGLPVEAYRKGSVLNESHWTDPDKASPYEKSKTLAELKAWELVKDTKTELVVINPGMVLGPIFDASQGTTSASSETVIRLVQKQYPMLPPLTLGTVDVRDVAEAHIKECCHCKNSLSCWTINSEIMGFARLSTRCRLWWCHWHPMSTLS